MIRKLILCLPLWVITSNSAIAVTTIAGCCSGTTCESINLGADCVSCTRDRDCALQPGPVIPTACPDECPDSEWTIVGSPSFINPNYETRCGLTGTCQYRCSAGAYGNPTSSSSGCSLCPLAGNSPWWRGRSESGATSITGCYIPAGTTSADDTGNFEFTENCYYSN